MKHLPAALLAFVFVVPPAMAAEDAPPGDLGGLQGRWKALVGPNRDSPLVLEIKGDELSMTVSDPQGEEHTLRGKVKVDETTSPRAMDWIDVKADDRELPDMKAIYALDGDTLKIRGSGRNQDRPTSFDEGADEADGPRRTLVLTRERDQEDAPAGDLTRFQGTWTGMVGPNDEIPITVTIQDKTVKATFKDDQGNDRSIQGEFRIKEDTSPRQVDWVKFTGPDGQELPDNQAIYEFQGEDTLRICNGGPGNPRPTEFKDGGDGEPSLIVLKKSK